MTNKRYSFVPAGSGPNYDWSRDHTFVKVSTEATGGAFTLMQDNLKPEFALGLHMHRAHAETFYILDGTVDFYIDGDWMAASTGASVHIPPGVKHAVALPPDGMGRMLMIFQPGGFDRYLAELAALTPDQMADEAFVKRLSERYDIIELGDVPPRA